MKDKKEKKKVCIYHKCRICGKVKKKDTSGFPKSYGTCKKINSDMIQYNLVPSPDKEYDEDKQQILCSECHYNVNIFTFI